MIKHFILLWNAINMWGGIDNIRKLISHVGIIFWVQKLQITGKFTIYLAQNEVFQLQEV